MNTEQLPLARDITGYEVPKNDIGFSTMTYVQGWSDPSIKYIVVINPNAGQIVLALFKHCNNCLLPCKVGRAA